MNKYIVITVLALAVLFVGVSYPKPSSPASVDEEGLFSRIFERISNSLGSVTGPDSYFDAYNDNGVITYPRYTTHLTNASTSCAFINPLGATSTIWRSATWNISSSGTSSAGIAEIAIGNNAYSTTTVIARQSVPANSAGVTLVATSSVDSSRIVRPGQYIVYKMSSGGANAQQFQPNGTSTCSAVFEGI